MNTIDYGTAQARLAKIMDRVCEDHSAVIVKRKGGPSVVMLSLVDYRALEETAYLLRSPANARRLLGAVHELAPLASWGEAHEAIDSPHRPPHRQRGGSPVAQQITTSTSVAKAVKPK